MVFNYHFFLVSTLLTKQKRSQIGLDSTEPAFNQLTKSCHQQNLPVEAWRAAEHLAMEERGEHLKIFDINYKKAPHLLKSPSHSPIPKTTQIALQTLLIGLLMGLMPKMISESSI